MGGALHIANGLMFIGILYQAWQLEAHVARSRRRNVSRKTENFFPAHFNVNFTIIKMDSIPSYEKIPDRKIFQPLDILQNIAESNRKKVSAVAEVITEHYLHSKSHQQKKVSPPPTSSDNILQKICQRSSETLFPPPSLPSNGNGQADPTPTGKEARSTPPPLERADPSRSLERSGSSTEHKTGEEENEAKDQRPPLQAAPPQVSNNCDNKNKVSAPPSPSLTTTSPSDGQPPSLEDRSPTDTDEDLPSFQSSSSRSATDSFGTMPQTQEEGADLNATHGGFWDDTSSTRSMSTEEQLPMKSYCWPNQSSTLRHLYDSPLQQNELLSAEEPLCVPSHPEP